MIIAIDFDGTITESDDFNKPMKLRHLAKDVITELAKKHTLILWTCREEEKLHSAKQFLLKNEMLNLFSYMNENAYENITKYNNDCRKIGADIYIDDKIIGGFIGWDRIYDVFF